MNLKGRLYGISAYAGVGKDTFCQLMLNVVDEKDNLRGMRMAFADNLKHRLDPFLIKEVGISACTQIPEEKDIIRPILVAYGEAMRNMDPDYWVNLLVKHIQRYEDLINTSKSKTAANISLHDIVYVIPDVRYENEAKRLKSLGGKIIHLDRDGVNAPNTSEEENAPLVRDMSDFIVNWNTFENEDKMKKEGLQIANSILN